MTDSHDRERSGLASPRGLRAPRRTSSGFIGIARLPLRAAADTALWFIAIAVGALGMGASVAHGATAGLAAATLQATLGTATGLYRGRWRLASFDEAVALSGVVAAVAAAVAGAVALGARLGVTLAFNFLAPFAALSAMLFARGFKRGLSERRSATALQDQTQVLVFGAGDAGAQLVRSMLGNPHSVYRPVALFDDDSTKAKLRIQGVPVRGSRQDIAAVARDTSTTMLIAAVPSAPSSTIADLERITADAGLDLRVLPPIQELIDGVVSESDVREVTEADLLGRRTIDTDLDAIASYLTGARVLVTGAGGSIGSELCRQIYRFAPAQLIMLDRDESALHSVQMSIEGRALLDSRNLVVADIRDGERLSQVFTEHRPDVVFHAAALKHLPLLEMYALEGWKTNVLGTNNVLRAAASSGGVTHFVNVSTDKAADPTSVLGYTKRIAEQLTSWYAHRSRGAWVSVRFGNVLGSRGSVLEAFRTQVEQGGPITVTHPKVTRYFMTPQEACQLVIQAGAVGHRGEALVLDMGDPVRILDVAERLAAASPTPIKIVFTGLRPGEKLHEDLISSGELDIRPAHPLISHVSVPAMQPPQLGLLDDSSNGSAKRSMRSLCLHEYQDDAITL